MSSTGTGTQTDIQALFSTIGQQLLGDATGIAKGLLITFFTNVQKNPTIQNVLAQGAILQASLLLSGPTLEAQSIAQIAADGLGFLNKL